MIRSTDLYKLELRLIISSQELSAHAISERLGIAPTNSRYLGEIPRAGSAPVKANIWRLYSGIDPRNSSIKEQFDGLKRSLKGKYNKLKDLGNHADISIVLVLYIKDELPDLTFLPEHVRFVGYIRFKLSISIYDLRDD